MVDGANIGGTIEIFAGKDGETLQFRTLTGGDNVSITQCQDTIKIDASGGDIIGVTLGSVGSQVFKTKIGNEMQFRRLIGGTNIDVVEDENTITINHVSDGYVFDGKNLGTEDEGYPVFHDNNDGVMRFKRLYPGAGVEIIDNGCSLVIKADVDTTGLNLGEKNIGRNLGNGYEIYAGKTEDALLFKTFVAGPGLEVIDDGHTMIISASGSAAVEGSNIGPGAGIYSHKTGDTLRFKSLVGGAGVTLQEGADGITISAGNGGTLGELTAGDYNDPRFDGCPPPAILGLTPDTLISDAFDKLNKLLGVALAPRPDMLETKTLEMTGGAMDVMPVGATDHTGGMAPSAGEPIYLITENPVSTNVVSSFGSGNTGSLIALLNGQPYGTIDLGKGDDAGTDGILEIMRNDPFTTNPCLWEDMDARITASVVPGVNSLQLVHTETGSTNKVFFLLEEGLPKLSVSDMTIAENAGNAIFVVVLSRPMAETVSVDYVTTDGTALSGIDYAPSNGTLVFAPGETSKQISVLITDDLDVEGNEIFYLDLSNPVGAEISPTNRATGTIVDDEQPADITLVDFSVDEITPAYRFSSGIPHYSQDTVLGLAASFDGLVGSGGAVSSPMIEFGTSPVFGTLSSVNSGEYGIPLNSNEGDTITASQVPYDISGLGHTTSTLQVRGQNVSGYGLWNDDVNTVMLMVGDPVSTINGPVKESGLVVDNIGSMPSGAPLGAVRIMMSDGDKPADDVSTLTDTNWVSEDPISAWDAIIASGVLSNNRTDYSTGHVPVGPDMSGQNSVQYATFLMRRGAVSNFKIEIAGTYSGLWMKMPGLIDPFTGMALDIPNAENGWWDAMKSYAGAGVPGSAGVSDGIGDPQVGVLDGSDGTFGVTFGQTNSTFASNNNILIRFRLEEGDAITGIRFVK